MDCARNIITAAFPAGKTETTTAPLWQWDYGQALCITGIDLPAAFEVHFSTNRTGGVSTVAVGADGQVTIPNVLLTIGKNLNAWIFLSDAQGEGETEYSILIPVKARPMPETYDAEVSGEFDDVVRQVSEYAQTAQTAADNAGASASAAAASADSAAASASAADAAKTAAETAQGKAEDAQAAAETAAQAATQKATQTAQDAAQAAQSKADAESAAQRAEAAQTGAESAKTDAETAAQGAETAATAAENAATEAGRVATSAAQSATAAAGSATTAGNAAQTATTKAGEASASADAAAASETAAQTAQTGAETAATNAGQSASTATTKASEAAQSASNAAASETAAEAAATRAEQAAATLTVDDALSDSSVNPVQNKVITGEVTQLKNAIDALKIVNTASGAIASFSDGAAMPMKSLTVNVEPVQDLHGYDSPWPAGGGKNLLNPETLTDNTTLDGTTGLPTASSGRIATTTPIDVSTLSSVAISWTTSLSNVVALYSTFASGTLVRRVVGVSNGSSIDVSNADQLYVSLYSNVTVTVTVADVPKFQIESGTTATTYAPYSNICPISGRESVTVWRTGKNILDTSTATTNAWNILGIPNTLKPNTQYTFSINGSTSVSYSLWLNNSSSASQTTTRLASYIGSGQRLTFTTPSVMTEQWLLIGGNASVSGGIDIDALRPQVVLGSTATDYEPYDDQSATIQLGQTVYGGTLDVVSGKLTVDRAMITPKSVVSVGTSNYIYCIVDIQSIPSYADNKGDLISNQFFVGSPTLYPGHCYLTNVGCYVVFCPIDQSLNTKELVDTWLQKNDVQFSYKLATPLEITLDPATLSTLKGDNNVWSDADSVTVEYVADPKLYIARLTEPDADMVADANITSGHYFMVGNTLYLATANIASGANIVPGVNCTRTNLAAALNAINA